MQECIVRGDGNCFYRCLSRSFYGHEDNHGKIRKETVDFIRPNTKHFKMMLDEPVSKHLHGRRESWATEMEIMAASALYGANIKHKHKHKVPGKVRMAYLYISHRW